MNINISELIAGAYDLHIHAAPSPFHRLMDDFELLHAASEVKMAGILLKSHYESTAARAEIANKYASSQTIAYGALVLNQPVGGLNPYAVHNALRRGAKIIFMPTRDAENSLCSGDMPGDFFQRPGLGIFMPDRQLKPAVYDIIEVIKQYDAALATGHLSGEESIALCQAGLDAGVRMVLTHPEFSRTKIPKSVQQELAQQGVLIEKCWYNIAAQECMAEQMANTIRLVGPEHCFMTTDRGQEDKETPVDGMHQFITTLYSCNITKEELTTMLKTVPEKVLNI